MPKLDRKQILKQIAQDWRTDFEGTLEEKIASFCCVIAFLDSRLPEQRYRSYMELLGLDLLDYSSFQLVKRFTTLVQGMGILFLEDRFEESLVELNDTYFRGMTDEGTQELAETIMQNYKDLVQSYSIVIDL